MIVALLPPAPLHPTPADTHERLSCLCPTPDGRLLLSAGTSGLVTLRWLHSLQVTFLAPPSPALVPTRLAGDTSRIRPGSCLAFLLTLSGVVPQVVLRYDGGRGAITALALTPEDCIVAGTAEGSVVLFAPDPRRRITRRLNLAEARPPQLQTQQPAGVGGASSGGSGAAGTTPAGSASLL